MLFQGVLLAAALQDQNSKPILEFIICFAGVLVSFYQMQMASGAKYWQEWWESRLEFYEGKLKEYSEESKPEFFDLFAVSTDDVYQKVESRLRKNRGERMTNFLILSSFSVSRAPIKVSVVLLFSWVLLTLHTLDFGKFPLIFDVIKGFLFIGQ
ncbi:hypothetical protein EV682_101306 [Iodobacter fluviatilis]|uniref:SMODS and SLOG-associating 2TM effector domain-containing protein n=2 Tax=Iodobacter fluviatilis TaxID=537 RepID=A0A377Q3H8_9NEIS|nr:hypothetical protein EV682_101306 [Iodobacter fluviatilis]STQ89308.1 Uncharacterised protein [Iodobacter fluviatilis]